MALSSQYENEMSSDERRARQRRKVLKGAKLVIGHPVGTLDAVVRDISDTGMKLELRTAMKLPPRMELILVAEQTRQDVQVMWQKGKMVGVRFDGPKVSTVTPVKKQRPGP